MNLFAVSLHLTSKTSAKIHTTRGHLSIDFGDIFGCSLTSIYSHIAKCCSDYDMNSRAEDPPMLFQARNADWKVLFQGGGSKTQRSLSVTTPEPSSAVLFERNSAV